MSLSLKNKLRQTLAMRKTHEKNQLIAKMNSLGVQSLFKEATAFVKKCCQKQHRIKGACMCINQLRINPILQHMTGRVYPQKSLMY